MTTSGTLVRSGEVCTLLLVSSGGTAPWPEALVAAVVVTLVPLSNLDSSNSGTEMPPIPIETEGAELSGTPLRDVTVSGSDLMTANAEAPSGFVTTFLGFLVVPAADTGLALEACLTRGLVPTGATEEGVVAGKRVR